MSELQIGSYTVETSSLDKIMFPADGITKGDLIDYYLRIASDMVPHMRDRPLSMRRYPGGIAQEGFYQQEAPEYFPGWIDRVTVEKEGGDIVHAVCNNAATLVYLANQNTITPHVWLSRTDKVRNPDQIVFDLDPPGGDFEPVRKAARYVRQILEEHGLPTFLMTTGSSVCTCGCPSGVTTTLTPCAAMLEALPRSFRGDIPMTLRPSNASRKGPVESTST